MWVYAFVPAQYTLQVSQPMYAPDAPGLTDEQRAELLEYDEDPFLYCHGPDATIALPQPDSVASTTADLIYPDYDRDHDQEPGPPVNYRDPQLVERRILDTMDAGRPVLAAVLLGTCGSAWVNDTGELWVCRTQNLTWPGRGLLTQLARLYSRDPVLVTYLDT